MLKTRSAHPTRFVAPVGDRGRSHRQVRGAALSLWDGPALASAVWQPSDNGTFRMGHPGCRVVRYRGTPARVPIIERSTLTGLAAAQSDRRGRIGPCGEANLSL